MGCCLLAAFLIAGVRRAWFALFPHRRPVPATFAPTATRPAPGEPAVLPPPAVVVSVRRIGTPIACAGAVAAYALVTSALDVAGMVETRGSLLRDALLAGVLALAVLVAVSQPAGRSRPDETGVALAVAGLTWTAVSLVDMHLLGGLEAVARIPLTELVVHGTGLAMLSTGVALMRAPALVRRLEGALA